MDKKLRRSNDKIIAGVCGGVAEYFDIDPTWVRIGFALFSFFSAGFVGLIVYLIFWFSMPKVGDGV